MSYTPHPLSLRQLQYAVAVADALSFRRAAEQCHVAQPSLSAQLAQLEDALGVRLFERDQRRVLLTAAGRDIVDHARRVLRDADELVATAQRARDPLAGTLRVGVIPTISPYLLPSITPPLREAFPRLLLIWTEDKTSTLVDRLAEGTLDAALLALEAEIGDLEHEIVATDPFVLATRPGDALGTRAAPAQASELADVPLLLLDDGHCFRDQTLSFCAGTRAQEQAFRATSLSTLAQMVAGGAGVTLLPALAVPTEAERAGLAIRAFAAPVPARTIALAWRKRSPIGEALRRVTATLRAGYPMYPAVPPTRGRGGRRPPRSPSP